MFSTKAESEVNRQLGCDLVGMTAIPEQNRPGEAEIGYSAIAMVTDYDVWHELHESVTVSLVCKTSSKMQRREKIFYALPCPSRRLAYMTAPASTLLKMRLSRDPAVIPAATRDRLNLLVGKYLTPVSAPK